MSCGATQDAGNRKLDSHFLFTLLVTFLYQVHPGEGSFLRGSKAVFARGCVDHWTLADPQRMPQLMQMTLCVDVRPLRAEGEWTAFTYSTLPAPHYSLALQGDTHGLYVWLLGVQHHFPTHLAPLRWHHVCLQHDTYRRTMTLEVDGEVFERTVITRAIPPAGELVLGCRSWDVVPAKWGAGGAELYLFRIWDDVRKHLACEDGSVVGWDSQDWHVIGISRFSDDMLLCALAPIAGRLFPSIMPATAASPPSTTKPPVISVASVVTPPEPLVVKCSFSEFCAIRTAYYWMSVNLETSGKKSEAQISAWLSQVFSISTCVSSNHTIISTSSDRGQNTCKNETETAVSLLEDLEVTCNTKVDISVTNCTVLLQLRQPTDNCMLRQVLQESSLDTSIQARVLGEVERVGKGLCQNGDTLTPDDGYVRCTSSTSFSEVCSSGGPVTVTCTYMETAYIPMVMHSPISQLCNRKEQQYCNCSGFCRDTAVYYLLDINILSAAISITDIRKMVSQLSSAQPCKSPVTICQSFHLISAVYQGAHLECHGTDSRLYSCRVVLKLSQPVEMCLASEVMLYLLKDSNDICFNGTITRAAICGWPSGPMDDLLNSTFTWVSANLNASQICDSLNPVIFSCMEDEILGVFLMESCRRPTTPPSTTASSPVTMHLSRPTVTPSSTHNFSNPFTTPNQFTTSTLHSTTTHNSTMITTQRHRVSPYNTTTQQRRTTLSSTAQQNTTAIVHTTTTQQNITELPLTPRTQQNTTAILYNTTPQQNTTALPLTATTQTNTTAILYHTTTQQNTTALPLTATALQNTTAFPLSATSQQNTTAVLHNINTQQSTTAIPLTATRQHNATAILLNTTTQQNTTALPLTTTTQQNITATLHNVTTQQNTTTLKLTATTQQNTTAILPNTTTQQNTTALPLTATTQQNTTALPLTANTQHNATAILLNTTKQQYTTVLPLTATTRQNTTAILPNTTIQQNTTAVPLTATKQQNTTALPLTATTQQNATDILHNTTTQQNTTALPLTATTQQNTKAIMLNTTTQQNTTALPLTATTQQNATVILLNTTKQQYTTALPLTATTQQNATDTLLNTITKQNTTALPLTATTQQNTTALPLTATTQQNTTAILLNTTKQQYTIALPLNASPQQNTTAILPNTTTQQNTTAVPLTATKQNTTALPLTATTQHNATAILLNTTTHQNTTAMPLTATRQQNTKAITLNTTTQQNTTAQSLTATTQQNATAILLNTTKQQQTTALPLTASPQQNTTAILLNITTQQNAINILLNTTTQQNTKALPLTATTQQYTTALQQTAKTQENATAIMLNTTKQQYTTALPLTASPQLSTTAILLNITTQQNTTAVPLTATTQQNATDIILNTTTQHNTTALPLSATTQQYTAAVPLTATTQQNATAFLLNTTVQQNTTALPPSATAQQNITAILHNITTQQNTTALPLTVTTQQNTTAILLNTTAVTQQNTTALPLTAATQQSTRDILLSTSTQQNTTVNQLNTTTQQNTTALPLTATTQQNTTAILLKTAAPNTTYLTLYVTEYNTTTIPLNTRLQPNVTSLPQNITSVNTTSFQMNTTQANITGFPQMTVIPYNTTTYIITVPQNKTQHNTTSLPLILTTQENTTAQPISPTTLYNTKYIPQQNTTPYNITTLPPNTVQHTTAVLATMTEQHNATSLPVNITMPWNISSLPNTKIQPKTIDRLTETTTQYNMTVHPIEITVHQNETITASLPKATTQQSTASLQVNATTKVSVANTQSNMSTYGAGLTTPHSVNQTRTQTTTIMSPSTNSKSTRTNTTANFTNPIVIPPVLPTVAPLTISTTDDATMEFTTVTMTTASEETQADKLLEQMRNISALNSSQVEQVVSRLEDLLSGPNVTLALGHKLLDIVSNLLNASANTLAASSSRIIRAVETLGLKLVVQSRTTTISSDSLALAVRKVDGDSFEEMSFSITDPNNLQIGVRGEQRARRRTGNPRAPTLGTITLPASLTDGLTVQEQLLASRVQFIFYQKTTVFQDSALGNRSLNSGVLATSVTNLSISGLRDNVVFTLQNNKPIQGNFVASCVFWDLNRNEGSGGWSSDGCIVENMTDEKTICSCNHLTSFAVLLDLSREGITDRLQAIIQTFITFIGCGISAIFLSITVLTYLAFEKLRRDIPSKILIQLCTALLLLNLTFLLDSWLALYSDAMGLCISTAFFLHYFLLVSFTWMGLEAFHMYLAIVKVFNSYMSRYMLKFSLFGWGVPLIVVIVVIAINKDNYGLISYGKYTDGSTDEFCWIKNDVAFYVAVVAYFCLVFVVNLAMFVVVMVQLSRIKQQNPHNSQHRNGLQELRSVAGLTFLLGLTWGFAFFAWGPVNLAFMYLFAILNSLQGFFIFVFHCALKDNVRRQWRAYLCCGRLQLPESTEWSRSTVQANNKKDSVFTGTSFQTSGSNLSSSTSFRTNESTELPSPTSVVSEDSVFTSPQEPNGDVVFNSRQRAQRPL